MLRRSLGCAGPCYTVIDAAVSTGRPAVINRSFLAAMINKYTPSAATLTATRMCKRELVLGKEHATTLLVH